MGGCNITQKQNTNMIFKDLKHKYNYERKMRRIERLKKYENKMNKSIEMNNQEAIGILKRRFFKNLITKEEYEAKLKKYE